MQSNPPDAENFLGKSNIYVGIWDLAFDILSWGNNRKNSIFHLNQNSVTTWSKDLF